MPCPTLRVIHSCLLSLSLRSDSPSTQGFQLPYDCDESLLARRPAVRATNAELGRSAIKEVPSRRCLDAQQRRRGGRTSPSPLPRPAARGMAWSLEEHPTKRWYETCTAPGLHVCGRRVPACMRVLGLSAHARTRVGDSASAIGNSTRGRSHSWPDSSGAPLNVRWYPSPRSQRGERPAPSHARVRRARRLARAAHFRFRTRSTFPHGWFSRSPVICQSG